MIDRILTRLRRMDADRVDLALTLLAATAIVVEAALLNDHGHSRIATAVCGVALSTSILIRRRHTLWAVALYSVPLLVDGALDGFLSLYTTTPFIVLLLLLYTVGRYVEGRLMIAGAAGLIVPMVALLWLQPSGPESSQVFWPIVLLSAPVIAGRTMRNRARLQQALRDQADALEAEQEVRALRAVDEERERIAAELQAIVANGVSAMVVQAEAVPRVLAAGDAVRAQDALATIEETGRDALAEMRRLLGVLRRDEDGPELAPQPGLARIDELARIDGLDVAVDFEGEPRDLPAGIDLAAFRVMQEALKGAAAAGAGSARVLIRFGERGLAITVTDDRPAGAPAPEMLTALRERVGLYDGYVRVDAANGAGWSVSAGFPLELVA